ncbi:HAMP domain-containing sensor histidine kinase [Hydrogenophaga sp. 5NK40-0174]|uniref:sensor histidine kinase n=1 Tax=Hydrogenophaga sp. 5NK40-0174 TaxID=3127649 RepID=UPI00310BFA9F
MVSHPISEDHGKPVMGEAGPEPDPVEEERLRLFFRHSIRALPGSIYPALVMWVWFYATTRSLTCLAWAFMIHVYQAFRLIHGRLHPASQRASSLLPKAEQRAALQLGVFGLAWGLAPWLLMPGNDHAQLSIIVLMLVGTMSGSALGLAYSLKVGWSFLACAGATMAGWMLWQRTWLDALLAVSMGVFTASLIILFRRQHLTLVENIRSRMTLGQQAEQLQVQNRQLEQLQSERDRMFATASHDLRQPVQSLSIQAQSLADRLSGPDKASAMRMAEVTESLSRSMDSILDLYRLESLSRSDPPEPVPVEDLFFQCAQVWSVMARRRQLDLRFHARAITVIAPRQTIQRVLHNLIDNALKFTEHGGILVAVRERQREQGRMARIEVWDTGVGIPAADQPQLFQPFFRATLPSGFASPQGLGLGLSAIRHVCEAQGWALSVRSAPAHGSVFAIEIPCKEEASEAAGPSI